MSDVGKKNPKYVYTDEEAQERYGKDEGREFGDMVQVCGTKLPKQRAIKFMKHSGAILAFAGCWRRARIELACET